MRIHGLVALFAVLALAGCAAQDDGQEMEPTAVPAAEDEGDAVGEGFGLPEDEEAREMNELVPGPDDDPLLSNLVLYFDFDNDNIRPEFQDMLAAHAEFLQDNADRHVRLEGHTDERGSREYNIGLGERRALSVRDYLLLQGVSASQITTVSYGEERPAALGSNEEAWAQNRRVELVYRQ